MNLKKIVAIAAAAGALAAISVPAMALENEFHGFYQIKGFLSNYNNAGADNQSPSVLRHNERANHYAEQRARIFYTGKASDDLKLVTAFEMDTRFGGVTNGKYTNSNDAGVFDGDGINFETKWAYLDFNAMQNLNVKVGLQPYKDGLKGLFIDADVPAVYTTLKLNPLTLGLGYTRFAEGNQTNTIAFGSGHLGDKATDLLLADATFAITKDIKVGMAYYLLANYQSQVAAVAPTYDSVTGAVKTQGAPSFDGLSPMVLHTLALSGEGKVGPLTLSGFAAMQLGQQKNSGVGYNNDATLLAGPTKKAGKNTYFHGFALNAAAKLAVGPGTAKVGALYVSGDEGSDNQNNAWVGTAAQSYNESGLMLLVRNNATSGTTTTNEFVRRTISNVILLNAGFDAKITPKAYVNANLGMAWSAKNTGSATDVATGRKNATNYIGTEIALEGGYKVYDNLTASVQAAYLILGGAYNGSAADSTVAAVKDPENPYTTRLVLTYAF